MANTKIDRIKLNGSDTVYDIDLPPDATPSISSLTVSGIKNAAMVSTDANGKLTKSDLPASFTEISYIKETHQYNDNIEVTEIYLQCEGMEGYVWSKIAFMAPNAPAASTIKYYYNYMGQKTQLTPTNASSLNNAISGSDVLLVSINNSDSNPTITYIGTLTLGQCYYSTDETRSKITYYMYNAPFGMSPALREISPDTHFTTGLYVGKVDEKSNSATTNGNTYLKLFDNDTKRAQHLINGGGATIVTSNASGTIEIATPIKTLDTTSGSGLGAGSENIAGSGTVYLHKVAKTGSYNDLVNKPTIPTIPTNLVTTNTEQHITGKKYLETEIGFGKYISPIRDVADAPANLVLMNFQNRNAGFFDAVMFAGAGDWLYLAHLKPEFSIRASFPGNGSAADTYDANLGYTHNWLDNLTNWDYMNGWRVQASKISASTPAIIQIKFSKGLYTDVLRLILTGHGLNDVGSGGAYSGFLDDYTIEVCTDYSKDTWATVVNRTNASDNIGQGLVYSLQTGSYTPCCGIRLKITKCHVTGTGYDFINITTMQLRDYRPAIKFPDCLGAISQGGGDVWGQLNTNSNLSTRNVIPQTAGSGYVGTGAMPYEGMYSNAFYENGTALSDKYLAKGTASTVVNQVVYNPVEMKKTLTVPSVQGTKYTDDSGNQQSLFTLGGTVSGSGNTSQGSSSLTLYRNRAGSWDSATISFTPADGLKIGNYAIGVQNWDNVPASYILTNGDGVTRDRNGGVKLKSSGGASSDDFVFESTNNGKLHSKMSIGPSGLVRGGWCIDNSKIITEATLSSAVGSISSESIVSICI